jgi:hypothetical protein
VPRWRYHKRGVTLECCIALGEVIVGHLSPSRHSSRAPAGKVWAFFAGRPTPTNGQPLPLALRAKPMTTRMASTSRHEPGSDFDSPAASAISQSFTVPSFGRISLKKQLRVLVEICCPADPDEQHRCVRSALAPFRVRGGSAGVANASLFSQLPGSRSSMAGTSPVGTTGENR